MDDNFEQKAEEFADDAAQAAEEAAENLTQSTENVWDKVEDTLEQAGDQVSQAAEQTWDHVEETAEEAGEQVSQAAETVQGTWSEVVEDVPVEKPVHEHTYGDEYVPDISDQCCEPDAQPDPLSAAEFASSPIGLGPDLMGPTITAQDVRAMRSDHIAESQKEAGKEKEFPVWGIILIILLVLCICIILPVLLVFGEGIAIFRNLFEGVGALLPFLFV